jgi:ubiquinone/menaquinone biosynthesis C-methylase UbiE
VNPAGDLTPVIDFSGVTERAGDRVTQDALRMLNTRYKFASKFCEDRDVLEVACGAGQGLGYLARLARSVTGGDYTEILLRDAQHHYRDWVPLVQLDAHELPFADHCFDVLILYEAIYYLNTPGRFLEECRRVLRRPGTVIICTANKELADFNPSPHSTRYFSLRELANLLASQSFKTEFYGAFPADRNSARDVIISAVKRAAVLLHLVPKTMARKAWLKRLFFGPLKPLPPEISDDAAHSEHPRQVYPNDSASAYRVLYAIGRIE